MYFDQAQPPDERPGRCPAHLSDLAAIVFCSALQPSQLPGRTAVLAAVAEILARDEVAVDWCVAEMAARYGDDPDSASRRMRWARSRAKSALLAGSATPDGTALDPQRGGGLAGVA